ncbi:MlaA family lipoprotein [Falsiroseomonas tokyonensis]|uniref:VacJ family lipoprotein n=1 Tax=Falsiroseomonas tokyonensis TaxID=430521 RepID=A0ABV7BQ67_9PROT|nr:VacJ family lipoprotein [Falsiroseomonas tokyonensis]MBU8537749.1 VacJ family lipoprotein [Falsiroseomonas tokyonensis]
MRRLLLAALLLAPGLAQAAPDPLEGVNRRIHGFNRVVQSWLLDPVVTAYVTHAPPPLRQGIANAFANLREPITAISGLAAGDFELAWHATARFGINSSLGLGGVRDSAAEWGFARRVALPADAVCAWGIPSGPYLVLPILGPSTLRDAGAMLASSAGLAQALGPHLFLPWRGSDLMVEYSQLSGELSRVEAQALDPYAVYRSAYLQRRAARCAVDRLAQEAEDQLAEAD